jgi:MFS family permease
VTRRIVKAPTAANDWKSFVYSLLLDLSLTAPIWVLYLRDKRGFSLTQITLLEVPLFLIMVFAEVPTGAVADRFGRRISLMIGGALFAVSSFVLGTATNYLLVLVANVIWGLAFTFRSGADTALLYDSLLETGRDAEFQRINGRLWGLRAAAAFAGLLLGAPIAAATDFTFVYMLCGVASIGAAAVALLMREPAIAQHAREPYWGTLTAGVRASWRDARLRYLILHSAAMGPIFAGPLLLALQPWLAGHGVATADVGFWQALARAGEVVSPFAAVWFLSRLGERGAFFALPLTLAVCCVALAGIGDLWIAIAFLGIALARGLHEPVLAESLNRDVRSEVRATVLSVRGTAGAVFMACVWPVAGLASDAYGLQAVFMMYAAMSVVFGAGMLVLWDRAARAHVAEDASAAPRLDATAFTAALPLDD